MFNNSEYDKDFQGGDWEDVIIVAAVPRGEPVRGGALGTSENYSYSPLSKPHIRAIGETDVLKGTCIAYNENSSYIKTCKGGETEAVGGGPRGAIKGFSQDARFRLLCAIAKIRRDAELPNFITLTYPAKFPNVERAKHDLNVFQWRMERKFPQAGWIWKLEPQARGAPHYHLLLWGVETSELFTWVVENWYGIAGDGDLNHKYFHLGLLHDSKPCVTKVNSFRGVWFYAAKYIGKTFEVAEWGKKWVGRFWGVKHSENIPFGNYSEIDLQLNDVFQLMRYQKRFMGKKRLNNRSLTTFCDADQWIKRLVMEDKEV
jgi:hypothetical protein